MTTAVRPGVQFVIDPSVYEGGRPSSPLDACADLDHVVQLNLQYHYTGPTCAAYWITLCQDPEYGHQDLAHTIHASVADIVASLKARFPQARRLNLVSLGPGDGDIDLRLLLSLTTEFQVRGYYGIDSSFELLRYAMTRIVDSTVLPKTLNIRGICGDFTKMSGVIENGDRAGAMNLFTLTGYTLGNNDETALLGAVSNVMKAGDCLLLDAHLHDLDDWDGSRPLTAAETQALIQGYDDPMCHRFAFGPAEMATTATAKDVRFGYDVNRSITKVPGALNIIIYCAGLNARTRLTGETIQRDRLDLCCTTRYRFPDLVAWLPTAGFEVLWHKREGATGLFLLVAGGA